MKLQHHLTACCAAHRQRGASLYVVIVMLATMGLMTLTAFYMSRNQYRLVGNIQYHEQAFNQAEAAAAVGENWLSDVNNAKSVDFITYNSAAPWVYPREKFAALGLNAKTMTWSDGNSIASGDGRYLVSLLATDVPVVGSDMSDEPDAPCNKVNIYQVIARSNPVRGASRTIETTYATKGSSCPPL